MIPQLRLHFGKQAAGFRRHRHVGLFRQTIKQVPKQNTIPSCGSGVNYQVIANKLRIGLMAQNYFANRFDYLTWMTGQTFNTTTTSTNIMGQLVFTANGSFGKLKEKVSKKKGFTNDDTLTVK